MRAVSTNTNAHQYRHSVRGGGAFCNNRSGSTPNGISCRLLSASLCHIIFSCTDRIDRSDPNISECCELSVVCYELLWFTTEAELSEGLTLCSTHRLIFSSSTCICLSSARNGLEALREETVDARACTSRRGLRPVATGSALCFTDLPSDFASEELRVPDVTFSNVCARLSCGCGCDCCGCCCGAAVVVGAGSDDDVVGAGSLPPPWEASFFCRSSYQRLRRSSSSCFCLSRAIHAFTFFFSWTVFAMTTFSRCDVIVFFVKSYLISLSVSSLEEREEISPFVS